MPQRKKPVKHRPKVENESTGNPRRERSQIGRDRTESGEPGGGAGRRDENVGGSGVYPASAEQHPPGAEVRLQGEWAQELGGQEGGTSELNPYDLGLTDRELEEEEEKE
ncbi:MAG: hypothetical protein ACT443_04875 [Gemmatimonadota bacterium]